MNIRNDCKDLLFLTLFPGLTEVERFLQLEFVFHSFIHVLLESVFDLFLGQVEYEISFSYFYFLKFSSKQKCCYLF